MIDEAIDDAGRLTRGALVLLVLAAGGWVTFSAARFGLRWMERGSPIRIARDAPHQYAVVRSAGPDREHGTADDLTSGGAIDAAD
jgi:hypothetical protein